MLCACAGSGVLRAGLDHGRPGRVPRRHCHVPGGRHHPQVPISRRLCRGTAFCWQRPSCPCALTKLMLCSSFTEALQHVRQVSGSVSALLKSFCVPVHTILLRKQCFHQHEAWCTCAGGTHKACCSPTDPIRRLALQCVPQLVSSEARAMQLGHGFERGDKPNC